jgi:hypothetical protein
MEDVRHYRREIRQILEVLGPPEAVVTVEPQLSDFPLQEEPATPGSPGSVSATPRPCCSR